MTDNQRTESGTERLLRVGTLTLTVLGPVLNTLAARLAERLERGNERTTDTDESVVAKQPLSNTLRERGELLVQELEELIERGTRLSQSLVVRSGEVTHDLVDRGNEASQELLKRSTEIRKELRKRGKKLNKDLSKRSEKLAKELNTRSEKIAKELNRRGKKVSKELSRRSQQATQQLSQRGGTFWIFLGFVVGLAGASVVAYVFIKQRVRQQQQLEEEQSFSLPYNGYLNNSVSAQGKVPATPTLQAPAQPAIAEESVPAVAVAEQKSPQNVPTNAAFVGIVSTRRYYPVATSLEELAVSEDGKKDVVYFLTEEEALRQGYSLGL